MDGLKMKQPLRFTEEGVFRVFSDTFVDFEDEFDDE